MTLLLFITAGAFPASPDLSEPVELHVFTVQESRLAGAAFDPRGTAALEETRLRLFGVPTLGEAFAQLPGVLWEQPAGRGGNSALYLRGAEPNFAKILVDGIEVNDLNDARGGSYGFGAVPILAVEEVVLLPGAQSAIHGSDALSGTIVVDTLGLSGQPPGLATEVLAQAEDAGFRRISGRVRWSGKQAWSKASLEGMEEENADDGSDFSAVRGTAGAAVALGSGIVRASVFGARIQREHFPDDSGGPRLAVLSERDRRETEEWGGSFRWRGEGENMAWETILGGYRFKEEADSPGVAPGLRDPFGVPPNRFDSKLERIKAGGFVRSLLLDWLEVALGGEILWETGTSDSFVEFPFGQVSGGYRRSVRTDSLFAEAGWAPQERLRLNAAVRWDDSESLASVATTRMAATVDLWPDRARLSVAYAEGFKRPSFFAMGNPLVGNPNLLPEEGETWEAELRTSFPRFGLALQQSLFRSTYRNLIDLAEGPPPRLLNRARVVTQGWTGEVTWDPGGRFFVSAHLTLLDFEVDGPPLRGRPRWSGGATLTLRPHGSWSAATTARFVGSRPDSSIPTAAVDLEGYWVNDWTVSWDLWERASLRLVLANVWNAGYETAVGFPGAGRTLRLSLRVRL